MVVYGVRIPKAKFPASMVLLLSAEPGHVTHSFEPCFSFRSSLSRIFIVYSICKCANMNFARVLTKFNLPGCVTPHFTSRLVSLFPCFSCSRFCFVLFHVTLFIYLSAHSFTSVQLFSLFTVSLCPTTENKQTNTQKNDVDSWPYRIVYT